MMTVEQVCDVIGRKQLADALNVSKSAITNSIAAGKFSPRWFRVVSDLCVENGIDCPDDLFGFIQPDNVKAEAADQ